MKHTRTFSSNSSTLRTLMLFGALLVMVLTLFGAWNVGTADAQAGYTCVYPPTGAGCQNWVGCNPTGSLVKCTNPATEDCDPNWHNCSVDLPGDGTELTRVGGGDITLGQDVAMSWDCPWASNGAGVTATSPSGGEATLFNGVDPGSSETHTPTEAGVWTYRLTCSWLLIDPAFDYGSFNVTVNPAVVNRTLTVNSLGASGVDITGTYNLTTPTSPISGIADGSSVTLTAEASVSGSGGAPHYFLGWTGCDSTGGPVASAWRGLPDRNRTCNVTMNSNKTVTARYSPSYNLSSNLTAITSGNTVTMQWTSSGATSCTALPNADGFSIGALSGSDPTNNLTSSTTFYMTCTGPGGTGPEDPQTITVNPAPGSSCAPAGSKYIWNGSRNAASNWFPSGDTSTWNWDLSDAGMTGNEIPPPVLASEFDAVNIPLGLAREWRIDFGEVRCGAALPSAPTANLQIRINGGAWENSLSGPIDATDDIDLQWTSSNAGSCTATAGAGFSTGGSTGSSDTTITTPAAGGSDTFTVECTGAGGTTADSITVNVNAAAGGTCTLGPLRSFGEATQGDCLAVVGAGGAACPAGAGPGDTIASADIGFASRCWYDNPQCSAANSKLTTYEFMRCGSYPTAEFTAPPSPHTINSGDPVTLQYETTNASECTIEQTTSGVPTASWTFYPMSGDTPTAGSQPVGAVTEDREYSISCTNGIGISPNSPDVDVNINAAPGTCIAGPEFTYSDLDGAPGIGSNPQCAAINYLAPIHGGTGMYANLANCPAASPGDPIDSAGCLTGVNFWGSPATRCEVRAMLCDTSNTPPNADAGPDDFITQPTNSYVADGTGSNDAEGAIASYNWAQVGSTPSVATIVNGNTANPTFNDLTSVGEYVFQLEVTDSDGAADTDTMRVEVVAPPACTTGPIVNMGGLNRITPTDDTCDGNQTLFTETPNSAAVAAASCRDYECPDCTAANGYKGIFGKYIDVTCGALPPPPLSPSAAIGVKVNGGATEYNDLTGASALEITDSIEIEWGSSGAGTCNATLGPGFDTGGAINGTDPVPNPGSGSTQTYTVNCDGDTDSITVEVEQASNLTIAFNPVGFPNLTPELDGDGNPTGSFTDVELQVIVSETGGVAVSTSFDVELAFDLNGDTTYDDSHTFTVNSIPANGAVPLTHTFNSFVIPFTPASVARAQVDIPLVGNGVITETNEGDNQATLSPIPSTLPAPNLNLELDPSDLVRGGGSVDIDYNTNAVYDMDCTLSGPGLSPDHTFNPSNPAQGPTGTLTATNITAKSIYTLSCTENITGTNQVFTETASVETTGTVQEI